MMQTTQPRATPSPKENICNNCFTLFLIVSHCFSVQRMLEALATTLRTYHKTQSFWVSTDGWNAKRDTSYRFHYSQVGFRLKSHPKYPKISENFWSIAKISRSEQQWGATSAAFPQGAFTSWKMDCSMCDTKEQNPGQKSCHKRLKPEWVHKDTISEERLNGPLALSLTLSLCDSGIDVQHL